MRKKQTRLTLETGLLAAFALALAGWTLLRLIGIATFGGAGCTQHGMHIDLTHLAEYCKPIKTIGYSGLANLLALATTTAGIYGAVQCFRGRAVGIIALIILFGLQSVALKLGGFSLYMPTALDFYYQYESAGFAIHINLLMFFLFLSAIGRYRNDF